MPLLRAIAAELGTQPATAPLHDPAEIDRRYRYWRRWAKVASASAVGLTGLFGYLGASFCGVVTGLLVDKFGWNGAIWLYASSVIVGCILLATTSRKVSPVIRGENPARIDR